MKNIGKTAILIYWCSVAAAQEFTPAECRLAGVDVADDRISTGTIVSESHNPDIGSVGCIRSGCHSLPFGVETAIGDHQYTISYTDPSKRTFAVCRAEYETRLIQKSIQPPPKKNAHE